MFPLFSSLLRERERLLNYIGLWLRYRGSSGAVAHHPDALFSMTLRRLGYARSHQYSDTGETEASPFGSPPERSEHWACSPFLSFPPLEEAESLEFPPSHIVMCQGAETMARGCHKFSCWLQCSWFYTCRGAGDFKLVSRYLIKGIGPCIIELVFLWEEEGVEAFYSAILLMLLQKH